MCIWCAMPIDAFGTNFRCGLSAFAAKEPSPQHGRRVHVGNGGGRKSAEGEG